MKEFLVLSVVALSCAFCTNVMANGTRTIAAEDPGICIGAENPESAYLSRVEAALVSSKLKAVPRSHIHKVVDDVHDPEYDVILNNGKKVHVTCDDSGDGQCDCSIAGK